MLDVVSWIGRKQFGNVFEKFWQQNEERKMWIWFLPFLMEQYNFCLFILSSILMSAGWPLNLKYTTVHSLQKFDDLVYSCHWIWSVYREQQSMLKFYWVGPWMFVWTMGISPISSCRIEMYMDGMDNCWI